MVKFGFIGLDDVTEVMAINLINNTNSIVYVYDAVTARCEYVAQKGGVPCEVISDVAERAEIIFVRHQKLADVQGTIFTIVANLDHQNIIIDMSPIAMEKSMELAEMVKATGADYADAPLIKSGTTIESTKVTMLYGGISTTYLRVSDYLSIMTDVVVRCGENTAGIGMYICYAMLLAQIQNGVNETLLVASKMGLYIDDIIKAMQASPAENAFLEEFGANIAQSSYQQRIYIKEIAGIVAMAKEYASDKAMGLKGLNMTNDIYVSAMDRKLMNHDISELYTIVKRSSPQ